MNFVRVKVHKVSLDFNKIIISYSFFWKFERRIATIVFRVGTQFA